MSEETVGSTNLTQMLSSSRTLAESLPPACGLYGKVGQQGSSINRKLSAAEVSKPVERVSSAVRNVREILQEILGNVITPTKREKAPKKLKPTNGWMDFSTIFSRFYIDDDMFDQLVFRENLLVSVFEDNSQFPTPIGALSLDIQSARGTPLKYQDQQTKGDFKNNKFLVHLSSQLDFYGHNGGSRITAWVDRTLQTLEENRREYVRLDDGLDQQSLYVNSQEDFYFLRHDKETDRMYSPVRAKNLICEGSNFILMRYLAITRFIGTFEVSTLYLNGDLCRNIYVCKGPSSGLINGSKLDVCKIYRTIIEECGIEHRAIVLMSLHGQILKQEWHDCNHILQINPLIKLQNMKPTGHEHVPLEKAYKDDIELLSLYLDAKTRNKKIIENYMNDHQEIKHMIADYVQTILQLKPEDVFEFTAKYFLSFTPYLLPETEYFKGAKAVDEDVYDQNYWKYI